MRVSVPTIPVASYLTPRVQINFQTAVERVTKFLASKNVLIITGAGVSVDSGIRAYRGNDGRYMNPNYKPIFYHELVEDTPTGYAYRQRYWSRSYLGYPPVRDAIPNPTHYALAALQYLDHAPTIITQNVDGLHHKASPFNAHETRKRILELHGTLHTVHCRKRHSIPREEFQHTLSKLNPVWKAFSDKIERSGVKPRTNPDGDVDIRGVDFTQFVVPECETCRHEGRSDRVLKPEVIFFGESINEDVRVKSFQLVDQCDSVFLVGTTLATYSAFRLLKHALEQRKPAMMLNLGPTRADGLDGLEKIDLPSREVLLEACRNLSGSQLITDKTLSRLLSSGVVCPPDYDETPTIPEL